MLKKESFVRPESQYSLWRSRPSAAITRERMGDDRPGVASSSNDRKPLEGREGMSTGEVNEWIVSGAVVAGSTTTMVMSTKQ